MKPRTYSLVTAIIFVLIALLHGLRLLRGWFAEIGGWEVPMWLSWIAFGIAGYLAYSGLKLAKRSTA